MPLVHCYNRLFTHNNNVWRGTDLVVYDQGLVSGELSLNRNGS